MPLNLISNFAANVAQRNLGMSDMAASTSLAKLSAGTRVLSAKDDAAGLAIGSRLNAEVVGLKSAAVNAGQAISMLQVSDGAMATVNDILTRMKSLSIQAGSGQLSATERSMLDTEYQALLSEVDRIAKDTEFAGTKLVDGSIVHTRNGAAYLVAVGVQDIVFRGDFTDTAVTIQYTSDQQFTIAGADGNFTGSIDSSVNDGSTMSASTVLTLSLSGDSKKIDIVLNTAWDVDLTKADGTLGLSGSNKSSFTFKVGTGSSTTADEIKVSVNSISKSALGLNNSKVTSASDANSASTAVGNAIDDLQTYRATVGANQNRLQFASQNIATTTENTEAARSQLLDLNVATEMSAFVSKQILVQAGVSMLAQANQLPQQLLRLFN